MKLRKSFYSLLAIICMMSVPVSAKSLAIITEKPKVVASDTKEEKPLVLPLKKGNTASKEDKAKPSTKSKEVKKESKPSAETAKNTKAEAKKVAPAEVKKEATVATKNVTTKDEWPASYGPLVRVFIGSYDSTIYVVPTGDVLVKGEKNSHRLKGQEEFVVHRRGSHIVVHGKNMGESIRIIPIQKEGDYSCSVNHASYRGEMIIRMNGSKNRLLLINAVPMEQYLYGVVPAEAVSSWPMAALEAQAVAARTYALHALKTPKSSFYDVENDTRSQVYNGKKAELERTTTAVNNTRGEVILYNGVPIDALFHADAGGHTENSEDVWGNKVPYLRSVKERPRTVRPSFVWQVKVERSRFENLLASAGKSVGKIKDISLSPLKELPTKSDDRFASGRVRSFTISGSKGTKTFTGSQIKSILGLKSMAFEFGTTPFSLTELKDNTPKKEEAKKVEKKKSKKSSKKSKKKDSELLPLQPGEKVLSKYVEKEDKKTSPAYSSSQYIYIRGYGYGHGLGLSQWGAADMAREDNGKDKDFYKKILRHYYQGVTIERRY